MSFIKVGETISISKNNLKEFSEIFQDSQISDRFTKIASLKTKEDDFLYYTSILLHSSKARMEQGQINKLAFDSQNLSETELVEKFAKFAKELKIIAPKANDFLYFTAIMMHSAEASLLDEKGQLKKHADGSPLNVVWEKKETPKGISWKWKCSDQSIKPYKNKNGDIFPHLELKAAYKNWVGKPLCIDHQSSSVDHVRGVIVDTYFDEPNYRIIALCALDRKNYPDLARKVETGYSTSVSMGTGVSTAICSDCGTVARVEADFCDCMKFKSCYGEINVGLNPIELSIVVNGADPKARIRQIVAATDNLEKYVLQENSLHSQEQQNLVKEKLAAINEEIKDLNRQNFLPTSNEEMVSHRNLTDVLGKLAHQIEDLSQKVSQLIIKEANSMADKKAYFQGTEEPASPGKEKYPKEEADALRFQDHHMTGQSPFPGTGPIEGMHPGYDSFGEGELERKRRLKRAEEEKEQRRLQRQSAINKVKESMNKTSYFQGTEEPTPGKPKYPKEEADKLRLEDHHMVGQSPFPGVGNIEGLHPSPESADVKDEAKRKEMLHRADEKLKANFIRQVSPDGKIDPKSTRWEIKAGDQLLVNATLWDVHGDKYPFHFDEFKSAPFARKLMAKIRAEGAEVVRGQLKKNAQDALPALPAAPPVATQAPQAMTDGGMPDGGDNLDAGGNGDPSGEVTDTIDKMEGLLSDLRKSFQTLTGKETQEDMQGFQNMVDSGAMPPSQTQALAFEKKTRQYLVKGFQDSGRKVAKVLDELKFAEEIRRSPQFKKMDRNDKKEFFGLVQEALDQSNEIVSECHLLSKALVKFARGRQIMIKRAENMHQQIKRAQETDPSKALLKQRDVDVVSPVAGRVYQKGDPFMPLDATPGVPYQPSAGSTATQTPAKPQVRKTVPAAKPKATVGPEKIDDKMPQPYGERKNLDSMLQGATQAISGQSFSGKAQKTPAPMNASVSADAGKPDAKADDGMADDSNDLKMDKDGKMEGTPEEVGKAMKAKEAKFDLSTKEGRAAQRAKLAADAVKYSDMLKVHKGGTTLKFDTKPSGDFAKVETLEETHKAMMDLAQAPVKVRKQAEEIARLVSEGKINPDKDFPGLIANGLDARAAQLYQTHIKQKSEQSGAALEIAKEQMQQKIAKEKEVVHIKVKRAYELAHEMAERGLCGSSSEDITKQAQSLIDFKDESFEQVKSQVARLPKKQASLMPVVGSMQSFVESTPIPVGMVQEDLVAQFAAAFNAPGKKY